MKSINVLTNDDLYLILEHEFYQRIQRQFGYSGQDLQNAQISFLKRQFLDRNRIGFFVFQALSKYGYSNGETQEAKEQLIDMYESIVHSLLEKQSA